MIHKQYFLILIPVILIIYILSNNNSSLAIPPFIREEVRDELNDVYDLEKCHYDRNVCDKADNTLNEVKSVDIEGASYVSDGRFINTSLWLSGNPIINSNSGYIVFIDIDSNPDTGAGDGAEYMIQLSLDKTLKKWVKQLFERSDFHRTNFVKNFGIINKEIRENSSITNPLHIDIDLKDINFPKSFNMLFYATTEAQFEDSTSWIHIPPPEIHISFSENPLNIRPGETKTIYTLINSTTGLEPLIQLLNENVTSKIKLTFLDEHQNIRLPPYGTTTVPIEIYAKDVKGGEQFFFPLNAKSSFPFKGFRPEYNSTNNNFTKPFADTEDGTNLAINIMNPIQPHEYLKTFVENWFNPLTGIYQAASGIIGGIAGYILAKIKNKKIKSNESVGKKDANMK